MYPDYVRCGDSLSTRLPVLRQATLATDRQHLAIESDVNSGRGNTRQIHKQLESAVILVNINSRYPAGGGKGPLIIAEDLMCIPLGAG